VNNKLNYPVIPGDSTLW